MIENSVVIIPGGTGQIGSRVVKMFEKKKATVVVPSISGNISRLPKGTHVIKGNYFRDEEVEKITREIVEKYGSPGILIYMAGVWVGHKKITDILYSDVLEMVDTELHGFLNFLRYMMPYIESSDGRVIAMGSFSMGQGKPLLGAHSFVKLSLEEIIKTVANEYGPYGVRANMVAPSIVCTETEKKRYPGVEEKYLVPVDVIVNCIEMLVYEDLGEYLNGQTIGLCSPWQKYLDERVSDLRSRGCSDIGKSSVNKC
jgi:NAD(P)-dependent dehydrogenase (short-subunit alcohol dehydrogenase family)